MRAIGLACQIESILTGVLALLVLLADGCRFRLGCLGVLLADLDANRGLTASRLAGHRTDGVNPSAGSLRAGARPSHTRFARLALVPAPSRTLFTGDLEGFDQIHRLSFGQCLPWRHTYPAAVIVVALIGERRLSFRMRAQNR